MADAVKIVRKPLVLPENFRDDRLPKGTFSMSQYSTYKKCPRQYEFSYVKGLRAPASSAMVKGLSLHAGAEMAVGHVIREKNIPDIDAVKAHVADTFEREKVSVEGWPVDESPGEAKDETLAAYDVYHNRALPTFRPIRVESGFARLIEGVPMIGYIDMVEEEPAPEGAGSPLVVSDLKLSSQTWSQEKLDRDPQFTLYAAVEGTTRVRVDNIVPLKKGVEYRPKTSRRTPHDTRVLMEDLVETVDLVRRGIFPMTSIDSWVCSPDWCGFWSSCRGRRT